MASRQGIDAVQDIQEQSEGTHHEVIKMVQIFGVPKVPGTLHSSDIPAKLIHCLDAVVGPASSCHVKMPLIIL